MAAFHALQEKVLSINFMTFKKLLDKVLHGIRWNPWLLGWYRVENIQVNMMFFHWQYIILVFLIVMFEYNKNMKALRIGPPNATIGKGWTLIRVAPDTEYPAAGYPANLFCRISGIRPDIRFHLPDIRIEKNSL